MKITTEARRTIRNGGGMFLGIRFHFPVSLVDDLQQMKWKQLTLSLGLIAWQWDFDFDYGFKRFLP